MLKSSIALWGLFPEPVETPDGISLSQTLPDWLSIATGKVAVTIVLFHVPPIVVNDEGLVVIFVQTVGVAPIPYWSSQFTVRVGAPLLSTFCNLKDKLNPVNPLVLVNCRQNAARLLLASP
jgi:hypothetical protein